MVFDNKTDHPERPRMPSQVTEHDFYRRDQVPTPTVPCEERYHVPIAWHVIESENGNGRVSDDTIRKAMMVLNGWFNILYKHLDVTNITLYCSIFSFVQIIFTYRWIQGQSFAFWLGKCLPFVISNLLALANSIFFHYSSGKKGNEILIRWHCFQF